VDLEGHKQDWEDLAELDPLWAILGAPEKRDGGWNQREFFATGEDEIGQVLLTAERLGLPVSRDQALDFGCGVGRLTRALADRFGECVGVDVSEQMVRLARELNADRNNCSFVVNAESDLRRFEDARFDLVYSSLVLQHLPSAELARAYMVEFLRVARPDGLVIFQMPTRIALLHRLQPKRRVYSLLRRIGVDRRLLFRHGHLDPTRMIALGREDVRATVESHGGRVVLADALQSEGGNRPTNPSIRYYVIPAA
jgi:SAM-dependent methyltransferase